MKINKNNFGIYMLYVYPVIFINSIIILALM